MKGLVLLLCFSMFLSAQKETYHDFRGRSYLRSGETYFNLRENGLRGDEVSAHRLIVKPRGNFPLTQVFMDNQGFPMFQVEPEMLLGGYYLLKINPLRFSQAEAFELARGISRLGMFEYMEFEAKVTFSALPCPSNDPHYMNGNQNALKIINVPQAWCHTKGSDHVVIAIIDDGFDYLHPDLENNLWANPEEDVNGNGKPDFTAVSQGGDLDGLDNDGNGKVDDLAGWDFRYGDNVPDVEGDHGTHVAGIIAAQRNNGIGVAGIAGGNGTVRGCSIMLIKYLYPSDFGYALSYAVNEGAHVINLSGGWESPVSIEWLQWGIDYTVFERGIPLVTAAGNDYNSGLQYPAKYDSTIAVSAINHDLDYGAAARGPELDLVAPQYIVTTAFGGTYFFGRHGSGFSGTSASAPQVCGVIGLMLSVNPSLKFQSGAIRQILEDTAIKLPGMNGQDWHWQFGYGAVNALQAVQQASSY